MPPIPPQSHVRVVYCPPPDSLIENYVRRVCAGLGEGYAEPDIADGLANFLKVVARAHANVLNARGGSSVDSASH